MKTKLMLLIFTLSFMVMAACAKEPGGKDKVIPDWDGTITKPDTADTSDIKIGTAEQLAWIAHSVNGTLVEVPAEDGGESTWSSDSNRTLDERTNAVHGTIVANNYAGKTITLTDHVALGGTPWPMIGRLDELAFGTDPLAGKGTGTPFSGTFDGQGYKIMSITIDQKDNIMGVGLFGYLQTPSDPDTKGNVTVKNLTLWTGTVKGGGYVGGIVGKGIGKGNTSGTGDRVILTALSTGPLLTVTGGSYTGEGTEDHFNRTPTGGVAGSVLDGDMSFCYNEAKVNGTQWLAGVIACLHDGQLTHSFNKGHVKGTLSIVGGVTAHSLKGVSGSTVAKTFNVFNANTVEGKSQVGGVLAYHELGTIDKSINSGLVIAGKNVESKGQIVGDANDDSSVTIGTGNYYIKTTDGTTDAGNRVVGTIGGVNGTTEGLDINSADNKNKNLADMLNTAAGVALEGGNQIWEAKGSDIIFVTDKSRDKPL